MLQQRLALASSVLLDAVRDEQGALQLAERLAADILTPDTRLCLLFASSAYPADQLVPALSKVFGHVPLLGCTSAGEIGPDGYRRASLTGVALQGNDVDFELGLLEDLQHCSTRDMQAFAHGLRERLRARHYGPDRAYFAVMLVDGLSGREETLARAFHDGLGGMPLIGGSSGELSFRESRVLFNGRAVSQGVALLVGCTTRAVHAFKTQHFVPAETRMVVTGARPEQRIVTEINGCPAAEEYARNVGLDPACLGPDAFSAHPVVVRIGDSDFVRSIQRVNDDGSLSFFCAIDRGLVFKVAHGADLLANLEQALDEAERKVGGIDFVLGFDCILRLLEIRQDGLEAPVGACLARHHVVGFSTFGEQFRGLHVNQTFTGLAFGTGARQ